MLLEADDRLADVAHVASYGVMFEHELQKFVLRVVGVSKGRTQAA